MTLQGRVFFVRSDVAVFSSSGTYLNSTIMVIKIHTNVTPIKPNTLILTQKFSEKL